jgi:hypothetical protein
MDTRSSVVTVPVREWRFRGERYIYIHICVCVCLCDKVLQRCAKVSFALTMQKCNGAMLNTNKWGVTHIICSYVTTCRLRLLESLLSSYTGKQQNASTSILQKRDNVPIEIPLIITQVIMLQERRWERADFSFVKHYTRIFLLTRLFLSANDTDALLALYQHSYKWI